MSDTIMDNRNTEIDRIAQVLELPDSVIKMSKDLRDASKVLSGEEARFLVKLYYQMQKFRIGVGGQLRSLEGTEEPHAVLDWMSDQFKTMENQVSGSFKVFATNHPVGEWLMSIEGISHILSTALLAQVDIERAPTVGHIWSYAGFSQNMAWNKGELRPYNADFKTLCYKIGESFVKVRNKENDVYGKLFFEYKEKTWQKNLNGELSEAATKELEKKNYSKTTNAYKFYSGLVDLDYVKDIFESGASFPAVLPKKAILKTPDTPMLPPAHVHARARRYAVKLFLSHYHEVHYTIHYGKKPPEPYALAILEHAHKIEVPNFDPSYWLEGGTIDSWRNMNNSFMDD